LAGQTSARERLAQQLNEARRRAGLSGVQLAERLGRGWDQPRVSKVERGRRVPSEDAIRRWATITGTEPDHLLELSRRAKAEYATLRDMYATAGGAAHLQDRLVAIEAASTRIAVYSPTVILGLLQTPAYAHELLQRPPGAIAAGASEDEIGRMVASRLRRQAILYEPGREITLVIGEAALRSRYVSHATLRDQLLHLARTAETVTNAAIGVVPFSADLPFVTLHGWAIRDDVVTIEHGSGDLEIADPEQVERYTTWTATLLDIALVGADAATLARRIAVEMDLPRTHATRIPLEGRATQWGATARRSTGPRAATSCKASSSTSAHVTSELSADEFAEQLRSFSDSAFRLELQPAYLEPVEREGLAKFLAGHPEPPTEIPGLDSWFEQIAELTRQGKRVERVRVHEDPPTGYQQWARWASRWSIAAGEVIRYLTRATAHEIGLLPADSDRDWWLLDSDRLIVMSFDAEGRRIRNTLVTDHATVAQACAWRDRAIHHGALETGSAAARYEGSAHAREPDQGLSAGC
jgi:transcriptional regulator with XRE-family HTH domain